MATSTAFPASRVARGLAIETDYIAPDLTQPAGRPPQIFLFGVAQYDKSIAATPFEFVSLSDLNDKVGRKCPLYQAAQMIKPQFGTGYGGKLTIFPVATSGTETQAVGDITPSGTATAAETHYVKVNNKLSAPISIVATDSVAEWIAKAITAVNAIIDMPMIASDGTTKLDMTAGFYSDAGDHLYLEVVTPATTAFSFAFTQPTGGAATVDVSTAWAAFGDEWHSHVVNAMGDATDSTTLNSAQTFGEQRWGATVHKPFKMYTGSNEATAATIRAITDARSSDRINSIKWTPGSNDQPWNIAARMVALQCVRAASNPPRDYALIRCDLLTAGPAASQLDSDARDLAVNDGLSTVEIIDGEVYISDSVMCYHPAGEEPPGFRYDVDIEKECAMIYNIDLIFSNPADAGAPLIPNDQVTTNSDARKPSYFQRKLNTLYDGAALNAWITDSDFAKTNTSVSISSTPKRLDVSMVYKLSGNLNVISVDNNFSFYLG
jgi:phage tail sheath gpL-like